MPAISDLYPNRAADSARKAVNMPLENVCGRRPRSGHAMADRVIRTEAIRTALAKGAAA